MGFPFFHFLQHLNVFFSFCLYLQFLRSAYSIPYIHNINYIRDCIYISLLLFLTLSPAVFSRRPAIPNFEELLNIIHQIHLESSSLQHCAPTPGRLPAVVLRQTFSTRSASLPTYMTKLMLCTTVVLLYFLLNIFSIFLKAIMVIISNSSLQQAS